MPISCAAFNCTNRFQKGNGISFHRFPFSKPDLIEQWLINIRREGWKPSKYSHICSDHFDDDCYIGGPHRRRVLKPDAVPTKFNFTLTGHHRFSSKSLCQQFPECLIVVKEGEDNDNLYNPPEEHNISPEEDRKVIIPEDCSEEQKLNNVIDSTKPLDNRIFQVQEEELILPDQLKEQKLSRIDNSSKLPENGIFQIKEQESILPDQSEEQKLSRIDNLSENGIFQVQEQESILPDQSEQKLSSIDDSSKFLENGIFQMQEEESILPDQSEEEKLSSIDDSKLSENGIFQMQKQESSPKKEIWTASWSDIVFVEDFLHNEKLPLNTSTKRKSVKTKKVVYYGELTSNRERNKLNKENVKNKFIDHHISTLVTKEERILSPCVYQTDNAVQSANGIEQTYANNLIKTEVAEDSTPQGKQFESDNVLTVQNINNSIHSAHPSQSECITVVPHTSNKTTEQEIDAASQNNEYAYHQSDDMDVDASSTNNSNSVCKKEKQTNAGSFSPNPTVINGHTYNVTISPSEMKKHYDEIISKKNKKLAKLRKKLKRYKKQLARKKKTITTLKSTVIDLDFMNPKS